MDCQNESSCCYFRYTCPLKANVTKRVQAKPIIHGKDITLYDLEKVADGAPATYNMLPILLEDNKQLISAKSIACNNSTLFHNINGSNNESKIVANNSPVIFVDGESISLNTISGKENLLLNSKISCDSKDLGKVRQVLTLNSLLSPERAITDPVGIIRTICNTLHNIFISKELTDEWIISNCDTEEKRENMFLEFCEEHSDYIFRSNDPTRLSDMLRSDIMVTLSSRYDQALITLDTRNKLNDLVGGDKEHPIKSVPDLIAQACSCIHDDVADMVMHYSGKNVVCTDIKHKVVWIWNDNSKIWVEGSDDMLINSIMVNIRPIILSCMRLIHQNIKSGDDNVEKLDIFEKKLRQLFSKLGTVSYCASIALLIRARSYNPLFIDMLDNNNDILPINNGKVINLRTGEVRERLREDYCTFICPADYNPGTTSVAIDNFLDDITLGDNDLKLFLQGILGLCLTGHTHTQQMYIFYGPGGANGKTTLINMVATVLGSFFVQAHKEVFLRVNGCGAGNASPYIAELRGKRMSVFCEAEVGDKINEGQIKAFTGGDKIKCRPLYKSGIEFTPHFKPFVLTNHKPDCSTDEALWRRLIMVPFDCKYVDNSTNLLPHERVKKNQI